MNYKRFDDTVVVGLERSDEICSSLLEICKKENIRLGSVVGIGACESIEIGVYKIDERKFYPKKMIGIFEMTNLTGNVTTKDDEIYLHLHASFADESGKVVGGHLSCGTVSAVAEIFIHITDGCVTRYHDTEVTGLNVLDFREV